MQNILLQSLIKIDKFLTYDIFNTKNTCLLESIPENEKLALSENQFLTVSDKDFTRTTCQDDLEICMRAVIKALIYLPVRHIEEKQDVIISYLGDDCSSCLSGNV